jgi:predicted DNA-binding protein
MEDVLLAFVLTLGFVGIPTIAYTATRISKQWVALREKQLALQAQYTSDAVERKLAAVQDLALRVQVLERIATDQTGRLAAEIEDLHATGAN